MLALWVLMKTTTLVLLLLIPAGAVLTCAAQSLSDLDPALRTALLHDAACARDANTTNAPAASPSVVEVTRFPAGKQTGIIVVPRGLCPCENGNCPTFVYLHSGEKYRLTLQSDVASLRPVRRSSHLGFPDLSGKSQVSASQSETVVYEWDGSDYHPMLCATITQHPGQKRPAIVKHACDKSIKGQKVSSTPN